MNTEQLTAIYFFVYSFVIAFVIVTEVVTAIRRVRALGGGRG